MKKNSKVLFLLHLPPPVHGSSIVGKLIRDSKLINDSFDTKYINLLISRSVDESGKTSVFKLFRFIASWFKLFFKLIIEKPNLCYFALTATGSAFYKDVTLVFLLKLFRVKTVFHLHNKGVRKNESNKINHFLYRYIFNNNNVILLSNYLYNDVKTFVPKNRVYICHNGVENVVNKNRLNGNAESEPIKILFLSNLIASKGVFVLIEACGILQQKGYEFSCAFVGGEGDVNAHQFKSEVKRIGVKNVEYLGRKYGDEKNGVYLDADIFVLPTFYSNECFPLVLLEAMQYSLPIISTDEGGIKDIVEDGETGFIVKENDPNELAEKLELLLNNKSLRLQMGNAGRMKYEKEFTLQAFETRLHEILLHLLLNQID